VQHAYRTLVEEHEKTAQSQRGSTRPTADAKSLAPSSGGSSGLARLPAPKGDERVDWELKEHRALVEAWFERDGVQLASGLAALAAATGALGLVACDVGATNTNERGELMYNQARAHEKTHHRRLSFVPRPNAPPAAASRALVPPSLVRSSAST
jgi:hypothetical protein